MKIGRITQAFKAMTLEDIILNKNKNQIMSFGSKSEYSIKIATTPEHLKQAYQLTYQAYLEKGYVNKNQSELLIPKGIKENNSIVIVALKDDDVIGTLTVAFDSVDRLPADSIFKSELNTLRNNQKSIAEVISLSLLPNMKNSPIILNNLINTLFILCLNIKAIDNLVITVNPRHTAFYIKKVLFKRLGNCRPYNKVKGAPAVLLMLSLIDYHNSITAHRNNLKPDKTIFKSFANKEKETIIQKILMKQLLTKNSIHQDSEFAMEAI